MISIILPFYNRMDMMMQRMLEFHTYLHQGTNQIPPNKVFKPEDIEILLVNNGSRPETYDEARIFYWQKMVGWYPVRYLKWETNVGFGGAMNRGAAKADGDTLVFWSDDVVLRGNPLHLIDTILSQNPTTLIGGEMIYWPAGWNEFEIEGKKVVVPYANGWLLACRKTTWIESGGFDPIYTPYDFEDVDLSTRWHQMGYPITALNTDLVRHIGGATINAMDPAREQHTLLHRQKYIAKWCDKLLDIMKDEK